MITTSLELSFLVLAVEFALVATVIAFCAYRNTRSSEAKTTSEATQLVSKVAESEESRRLALETVFRDKYNYEGNDLQAAVAEFMQREKAFYNAVVGAVLGRGDCKISDINNELTKVVAPWISITPKNMVDAHSAELLKADKGRLEVELGETKETLEKMILEYNRAFHLHSEEQRAADESRPQESAHVEDAEEAEIEYQTEELHDLDDILESIAVKKKPVEDLNIVKLDAAPDAVDDDASATTSTPATETAADEEPDDEDPSFFLDGEDTAATDKGAPADKQMTADDLDELMESLESLDADEPLDAA
jgi:hypothetical protein